MSKNTLLKEWMSLSLKERDFVRGLKTAAQNKSEEIGLNALKLGFIKVENDKFVISHKLILMTRNYALQNLNVEKIKTKLRDGQITKEYANLILDFHEDLIRQLRLELDDVVSISENCEHDYIPKTSSWTWCLFNKDQIYTWNSSCSACGRSKHETTKNDEDIPSGFSDIKPRNHNIR